MFAAVICVLAPWSIPLTVPITLGSFAVMLCSQVLSPLESAVCVLIYLLLGGIGVPVFSGFQGGFAVLLSPTGGYLIGYIPLSIIVSICAKKNFRDKAKKNIFRIIGGIIGTLVLYTVGTVWFCFITETEIITAITVCVLPFILFDLLKIVCATLLGNIICDRIGKITG